MGLLDLGFVPSPKHTGKPMCGALGGIASGSFFTAPLLLNMSAEAVMNIEVLVMNQSIGSRFRITPCPVLGDHDEGDSALEHGARWDLPRLHELLHMDPTQSLCYPRSYPRP